MNPNTTYIESTKYYCDNLCAPFNTQEIIFGMEDQLPRTTLNTAVMAPPTITFKAFDESHLYSVNDFSGKSFSFQPGIQKMIHLHSIKIFSYDFDTKIFESLLEYISPVAQIKVFHCFDFKFQDLKGMNLPALFHLERLIIKSGILESASN